MRRDEFPIIDKVIEQERNAIIDRVLEIIDRTIDEDDKSPISWTAACKAIRRDVLALKGELG